MLSSLISTCFCIPFNLSRGTKMLVRCPESMEIHLPCRLSYLVSSINLYLIVHRIRKHFQKQVRVEISLSKLMSDTNQWQLEIDSLCYQTKKETVDWTENLMDFGLGLQLARTATSYWDHHCLHFGILFMIQLQHSYFKYDPRKHFQKQVPIEIWDNTLPPSFILNIMISNILQWQIFLLIFMCNNSLFVF